MPTNLSCSVGPYLETKKISLPHIFTDQLNKLIQPVIKEEFFPRMNKPLGEDTDSVVAVHHHYFGVTIWVDRVIGKANLVTLPGGINHKV